MAKATHFILLNTASLFIGRLKGYAQLLPFRGGQNKFNATAISLSTLPLIPLGVFLISSGLLAPYAGLSIIGLSIIFSYQCYAVTKTRKMASAKALIFSSFIYLPLVQAIMVKGKI